MDAGKAGIIGALIAAAAAIAVAVIGANTDLVHFGHTKDPNLRFPVAVFDAATKGGIPDAEVSLNIPDLSSESTDSGGKHTFPLTTAIIGKAAELTVKKSGYGPYSEQILALHPQDDFHKVFLTPLQATLPPVPKAELPAEVTRVYSSGQKISGSRANFSDWYSLCSTDEPGYHIKSADFSLSGDRSCNAWSQCQQLSISPTQACWQFRMQGHNEWSGSGQASSEGILKVIWARNA